MQDNEACCPKCQNVFVPVTYTATVRELSRDISPGRIIDLHVRFIGESLYDSFMLPPTVAVDRDGFTVQEEIEYTQNAIDAAIAERLKVLVEGRAGMQRMGADFASVR